MHYWRKLMMPNFIWGLQKIDKDIADLLCLLDGVHLLEEKQLYNCVNYIHNNPIKAGIVKSIEEYKYSSYYEIIKKNPVLEDPGGITKTSQTPDILSI